MPVFLLSTIGAYNSLELRQEKLIFNSAFRYRSFLLLVYDRLFSKP